MITRCVRWTIVVLGIWCGFPVWGLEQDMTASRTSVWDAFSSDGFSYRVEGLGYGFARDPVTDSTLNPDNVLGVSSSQATGELRLDMKLLYDSLELGIKPRLDITWREWNFGPSEGESDTDTEAFIYEWHFRYRFTDRLFAFYGLENLQWGPSFLTSPSNPFIPFNGKNNPYLEVPGLDYAKINWIVNSTWSAQLIANTDDGRLDSVKPFQKVYAGKVDFVGIGSYGSIIVSHREDGPTRLGGYAGISISDATLGYFEADVDDNSYVRALIGASYTFFDGSTVAMEYYYNGDGCRASEIQFCFPPYGETVPGQPLYLTNYGFIQYINNEFITPSLELALRGTINFDDQSSLLTAIANYEIGNHMELFSVADWYTGSEGDEFGSILKYSIMGGIRLTY